MGKSKKNGTGKAIAIGVAVIVIASVILLFVNSAFTDYAELHYHLEGPDSFLALPNSNTADITLSEGNSGNLDAVPTSEITVANATITGVSIPNVAQYDLYNYCRYNATYAIISNLTITKATARYNFATIQITPNNETTSFSVTASVSLPNDYLHLRNNTFRDLPIALIYNRTNPYLNTYYYEQLK